MRNLLLLSAMTSLVGGGYSLRWSRIIYCLSGKQRIFVYISSDIWVIVGLVKIVSSTHARSIKQSKKESSHLVKCASTPLFTSYLYLGAIVRIKQTRCFLTVTTHRHKFCKYYTFDFIGIFKFDDEQDNHMNTDAFMQTYLPLAF